MYTNPSDLRTAIEGHLTKAGIPFRDRGGRLSVTRGSSAVFIKATSLNERHTLVELLVPLLSGVESSPGVLEKLNELNLGLYFGKAYWHDSGIWIAHNLLGNHLDGDELIAAVGMLSSVADQLDDDLRSKFGGTRWIDT